MAIKVPGEVGSENLLVFAKNYTHQYGSHVIEHRALPDYRDGLKPVHRRILWSMHKLGLTAGGSYSKAARTVGDTMGKYHPHGDSSIYQAMVGMSQSTSPVPLVDGEGNWGSLTDNAAAMRYTEARLTRYAQATMFKPEYLATMPFIENYDGKDQEPLRLPSLLPNLLLNGTFGIAVGTSSHIPPLRMDSLMPLIQRKIEGKSLEPKHFKKNLAFNWRFGSHIVSDDEAIDAWLTNGVGSLRFECDYMLDEQTRTITVTGVPPQFNWEVVVKRLADMAFVSNYDDLASSKTSEVCFVVKMKNTVPFDEFHDKAEVVIKAFSASFAMATNFTLRHTGDSVEFRRGNLANLLSLWTDYRIGLEIDAQKYIIGTLDARLAYQKLMLLASENRVAIIKALDADDPNAELVKRLKITSEQAHTILELKVRQISRLSGDEFKRNIDALKTERKQAIQHRDNPGPKVLSDINKALPFTEEKPRLAIAGKRRKRRKK